MLKEACVSDYVLCTPDWTKPFIMETDTSDFAMSAVIMQDHEDRRHLIIFHSCSFLPAECHYDTHDKELGGIVFGFKSELHTQFKFAPMTVTSNTFGTPKKSLVNKHDGLNTFKTSTTL